MTDKLLQIKADLNALCQLQEVVLNNPDNTAKECAQSYAIMKVAGVAPDTGEPRTPFAHILRSFAQLPDVTFRQFLDSLVEGNDATKLIEDVRENGI